MASFNNSDQMEFNATTAVSHRLMNEDNNNQKVMNTKALT